ncbi:MAG: DNA polymerase III subunit beta [Tidjanibacter sp.]|nr:DNA polymerase III subunit beta [Tidjanibacter sp.]MBQ3070747.1 DNA polymerase III subunit beta [Tidjanibacter sp.]MBR3683101.1 DNA polymerase III subunit beta [Tidjanibacter sp.]MBR7130148.1 DNA polymerase III subunit beta [Tidjanibacter sp.]
MKFTISSSALLATLSTTGKVVSNKNTLPILDYFLFDLKDGILKVTASDLETTLISTVAVDNVEREGTIAAPVKLMLDSLKEFSEQPLTIEADENTWEITVSWKSGSLKIPGTSGLGYPALPELADDKSEVDMDVDMMIGGINKTIFATADDHLRPIMNGIYVNIAEGEVTFVATDAHKLVKYNAQAEVPAASSFILPKKPSSLLRSILLKEENAVKVAFDKKNVVFNLSGSTLVCRLIEGVYPNYNAVIPAANPNKVIVDRAELLNAIKRVAVCSNQATNLVEFNIAANSINLATKDLDFSYSAQETVMCAYEGSPITIGFKSTFLVDILSNIETPSVVIELADSTRAGVFKPLYDEPQSATTLMLLMPMMINA